MTTEITARDKLLLYVVGMLAFIFFFVQFMLTPPGSQRRGRSKPGRGPAGADRHAGDHRPGRHHAAGQNRELGRFAQANANYYGLLSSAT